MIKASTVTVYLNDKFRSFNEPKYEISVNGKLSFDGNNLTKLWRKLKEHVIGLENVGWIPYELYDVDGPEIKLLDHYVFESGTLALSEIKKFIMQRYNEKIRS